MTDEKEREVCPRHRSRTRLRTPLPEGQAHLPGFEFCLVLDRRVLHFVKPPEWGALSFQSQAHGLHRTKKGEKASERGINGGARVAGGPVYAAKVT